jgi:hypothetical protein
MWSKGVHRRRAESWIRACVVLDCVTQARAQVAGATEVDGVGCG